ncbi:MAG: bifunctional folylpolyglutamate synthase/dihydrofolate synthase [Acetatifactor sp.]|nr:bifunctional folylpolyglutamate synthase/dihydrofolate synthase [Acetatifactor sp.]
MTEKDALEYIGSIQHYGIVPGLSSIRELCCRLGDPQNALRFVHIAGTNGKGSTLAFVSSILRCAGYRVGRYISPVIFQYRERIQVGERPISRSALCEGMELVREACKNMCEEGFLQPTPFEVETALAFWYFRKKKCDIVVLETGMGGLLDATNLVNTTITSVIASVSMDHMKFLGYTLEQIAAQKAGIIKENCPVVLLKQSEEVMRVVEREAVEKHASLVFADTGKASHVRYGMERQIFDYDGLRKLEISLAGQFQIDNAVLAVETIRTLVEQGYSVREDALRRGLKEAAWPGRFQVLRKNPLFVVDGAHNEDAAQKLARAIEFYFTNRRIIYIMGILKDKDHERIIDLTHGYADQIITVTPPDNPRAMHAYELAREIAEVHPEVTAVDSLEEAVEMSLLLAGKEDVILAFGSLSYLGRLMEIVARR